ncbi:signal transduction histidine kinase [Endobacter medicaginis]|uniref:histidine kinase n=4 Tax=Endobacter medicaginis TaxID=1181271 RepID=A0A839UXZ3_9PROT|nr:signal transduction histidine kinase [Endobacter medicaginis]MCX5476561.1 PAS domain-containing protein [Endobacter medicaginis]
MNFRLINVPDGELADRIRRFDWSATSLGPIAAWPPGLIYTVTHMLLSQVPYVLLWGIDGVMIYNDGYRKFAGPRHPGCLGAKVREAWPEIADFNDNVIRVGLAGQTLSYRGQELTVLRHGRPEQVWLDLDYAPVLGDDGRPQGVLVIVQETTERVQAEMALIDSREVERRHAERVQLALAAGAIIGTWVWDLTADRFTVDEAFATAFGLDPGLGRSGLSLAQVIATVHPDDHAGLVGAIDAAIARGGPYAHRYRVRRADGRYYWLEANGRVEHDADGVPTRFPGVLIDMEERRAVEAERDDALARLRLLNETLERPVAERSEELLRAEVALRQAQKMEAVGQLTGGLAHDFNNLLGGIVGALDLIERRLSQQDHRGLERYVGAARDAARRAAALTHRLLAFSRRQTLDPRPTDVNALVEGMIELIDRTVGPQITLECDLTASWGVRVDVSQLENAVLNLAINARDAMPHGGSIRIETRDVVLDEEAAGGFGIGAGDYLSLAIADTGTGMSPETAAKAFDPFFTTKPLGQGTGLGLSMIYGFARQSGGAVGIASQPGCGTTVTILLPRHAAAAAAMAHGEPPARAEPPRGTGRVALVVDDEPTVRLAVRELLGELGYRVIEAHDSTTGLAALEAPGVIDLLVTDVGLPGGMNGRQLAEAGLQRRPELKVLFITGYAETTVLRDGDLGPRMALLIKPFGLDALTRQIGLLDGSG